MGLALHTPCPEIYCLRLIDEYCENYAEILCVIVYRHVPETEFGTGSMKFLPKMQCQKMHQISKNAFLLLHT